MRIEIGIEGTNPRDRVTRGGAIEPGSRLWPYHTHYLNQEWVIVLRGEPTLRTPEGEHVLEEGDVVCFPRGKIGAHQISNRTDSPVRVLMLSSMIRGEIIWGVEGGTRTPEQGLNEAQQRRCSGVARSLHWTRGAKARSRSLRRPGRFH